MWICPVTLPQTQENFALSCFDMVVATNDLVYGVARVITIRLFFFPDCGFFLDLSSDNENLSVMMDSFDSNRLRKQKEH